MLVGWLSDSESPRGLDGFVQTWARRGSRLCPAYKDQSHDTRAVSPPKGSYRWLVLAAATLAQATASFAMLGVAALAGFLQQDFKLTAAETGLLITATYGAAVFSLLFVGDLLDRKSERMIIGVGGAIAFIALMMPPPAAAILPRFCFACSSPA